MPTKMALVSFNKCRPEECNEGNCLAVPVCPHKLIKQEAPGEVPMFYTSGCNGCGDCVRACPRKAIKIVGI